MDQLKSKMQAVIKYKYVILIVAIGVVFMLLPNNINKDPERKVQQPAIEQTTDEEALKQILQMIKGAGRVEVYLKKESTERYVYQTDTDSNTSQDRVDSNISTILITDSNRNQTGLIQTVLTPTYSGAVIVCDGAADAYVKLSVVDAVSKATGLGSDKISVLKMK